jgi:nitric oxide reductase subunit B
MTNYLGTAPELRETRKHYAMKEQTLPNAQRRSKLADFFFWTAWAAATERPGSDATYTNNWPHELLIDNKPTPENILWSIISIVLLIAGIGSLVWAWSFLSRQNQKFLLRLKIR